MRIDASQILSQGGIKIKAGSDSVTRSLKEGDIIRAEVLSAEKGSVVLKTEGGQTFKAKLDAEVFLAQGDKVLLEVTGKDKGLILLSVGSGEDVLEEPSRHMGQAREPADKSLEPYMGKLAELNMPVSESSARSMRSMMAANPGMTPEEAAFLASNKLTGDPALIKAALALLSNGEKTDEMVARLLALLSLAETDGGAKGLQSDSLTRPAAAEGLPVNDSMPPDIASLINSGSRIPISELPSPAASQSAALTDLLNQILSGAADTGGVRGQGNIAPPQSLPTIIAQNDAILQSTNVEIMQEVNQNDENILELGAFEAKNSHFQTSHIFEQGVINPDIGAGWLPAIAEGAMPGTLPGDAAIAREGAPPSAGTVTPAPLATPDNTDLASRSGGVKSPNSDISLLGAQLSALLSEIPEFKGTPPQALERFSGMLLRIAGESAEVPGGDIEKLQALLDKLFTRIAKGDTDAGARLREAREELYARLALIEEAISRAAHPARAEMQGQTQRLTDHVRLLNNIEQFAYMQLPVQLGEERKTAELYLFKRKGNRKPDPENVSILLALDLEHMGHWESLMNIRKKDVSIRMEVRGEREKEHFSENTVMLHEMLAEAGFKLVNTGITCSQQETTPLTALSALDKYTAGRSGAIDFWI